MALRELLAVFDVRADPKQLMAMDAAISGTFASLVNFGKILAGGAIIGGIASFITGQIQAAAETEIMAQRLGVTTEELRKFQFAAELGGASAEAASNGLRFLNKHIGEAVAGGGDAAATFAKMGVKLKDANGQARPVTDVAADLADGFQKMGTQGERTAAAMKLLGRGGVALLPAFAKGGEGIRAAYSDFEQLTAGIGADLPAAAHKAEQQLTRFHLVTGILKKQITLALLPAFTDVVTKMTLWGSTAAKVVQKSNLATVGMKLLGAGALFAAARFLLLNLQVALIAVALALVALAIEDIYTLFTGGDSLIGHFIDQLFGIGASAEFVAQVKKVASELFTVLGELAGPAKEVGKLLLEAFGASLPFIMNTIKTSLEVQVAIIKEMIELLFKAIKLTGKAGAFAGEKLSDFGHELGTTGLDPLADKLKSGGANLQNLADKHEWGKRLPGGANDPVLWSPGPGTTPAAGATEVKQTNTLEVNIHGATNPQAAANAVVNAAPSFWDKAAQKAKAALMVTAEDQ